MRRAALLLLFAIVACSGGSSPTEPRAPVANLSGIVHELNPPTFTRIPGVRLTIQGQTTTSDANGTFRLTGLAAGDTVLTLEKEGFRTRNQPLTLKTGENTTSQEMLPAP